MDGLVPCSLSGGLAAWLSVGCSTMAESCLSSASHWQMDEPPSLSFPDYSSPRRGGGDKKGNYVVDVRFDELSIIRFYLDCFS